jgi:hypothetical protein
MGLVSISVAVNGVFPHVIVLQAEGQKLRALHFVKKEDADFWIGYVTNVLKSTPVYEDQEMIGLDVKGSIPQWLDLVAGITVSEEGERDCEIRLSNSESDFFFYFNTSSEKQSWINSNLKKLAPVH